MKCCSRETRSISLRTNLCSCYSRSADHALSLFVVALALDRFGSRNELKTECNLSVGLAHVLWKAMEGEAATGADAPGAPSATLFDTVDGTQASMASGLDQVLLAGPSTKPVDADAKVTCIACICVPPRWRKRIGAAVTFALSTVATVMITH